MNTSSKLSRSMIVSIVCGIVLWVSFCVGALINMQSGTMPQGLLNFFGLFFFIVAIIGSIFGVLAIRKEDTKRIFAIIGLSLNLICLIPLLFADYIAANSRSKIPSIVYTPISISSPLSLPRLSGHQEKTRYT